MFKLKRAAIWPPYVVSLLGHFEGRVSVFFDELRIDYVLLRFSEIISLVCSDR